MMKKFLKILYIFVLIILGVYVFLTPVKTETNILKAIDNSELVTLSNKYASKINVLVEGETPENVSSIADMFDKNVDKSNLKTITSDKIFDTYKSHSSHLLSQNDRKLLQNNKFEQIKTQSIEKLYNPFFIPLLPENQDPYFLFTDFITELYHNTDIIQYDNKFYKVLNYEFSNNIALSPSLLNKEVKKFIELQKQHPKNIYLTGSPVHSYFASSRSMVEVNIISILSILFIITMCTYYFKTPKVLFPIASSLILGYLSGFLATALIWKNIHILTFVFSATLIGICIDYSLHFFISRENIVKSLTSSLITTICAFLILLFSGTILLKQIAVFTICGLISVYSFVLLFYPTNYKFDCRKLFEPDSKKLKPILIFMCICLSGLFFIKYNDDITSLYVPSKKLASAEKLLSDVTGKKGKITFAVTNSSNLQTNLETEEKIAELTNNYEALSKYIPSIKRQEENQKLINKLYKKPSQDIALTPDEFPLKDNFILEKNKTIMVLYDFEEPELLDNGIKYFNLKEDISNIVKNLRQNCMKLFAPVFLMILLILSVIYKPRKALKLILPPLLAVLFTASILSIFRIDLNLFHILAFFLVIGFSLDYSIFRMNDKKCNDAVLMSCMTSVFSFTLLAFTGFNLISSLGFVLAVGLLCSYVLSIIIIK